MSETVALVDYGSGNLHSAQKALERSASEAGLPSRIVLATQPETVAAADRVVLPGVGAFADCLAGLKAVDGMVEALHGVVASGKPLLGICVGMQLMATTGHEHGHHPGFDWVPGDVIALDPKGDGPFKIPHMGWNALELDDPHHPVLVGLPQSEGHAYFVHSYGFVPADPAHALAHTDFGGAVTAIIGRETVVGTQFHPEKSQAVGLALLRNFLLWRP